jgi:hypothetical protein
MGVVMGITAAVLGVAAGLVGLMVWTALFFPRRTACAGRALEARPGRCFLVGIVLTALLGTPVIALLNAPHGLAKLAGWALALPLVAVLIVGLTAMAELMGQRLRTLSPAVTPLAGLVRGAITLELAMLPPFLGWFLFAPLVGVTTVGAGAIGCLTHGHQGAPDGEVGDGAEWRRAETGCQGAEGDTEDPAVARSLVPVP